MTTTSRTGVRQVLAAVTGLVVISAIAISTGIIDFGPVIDMRLPFDSPQLGGLQPVMAAAGAAVLAAGLFCRKEPR